MLIIRYVIQRCSTAKISANGASRGQIQHGLVVLFGVGQGPTKLPPMPLAVDQQSAVASMQSTLLRCTDKILGLRVFPDEAGKMNRSIVDVKGRLAFVSQFTLFADCQKGFRPSFINAAPASVAEELYHLQLAHFEARFSIDLCPISGIFAADMEIELVNQGPITIVLDADAKGFLGESAVRGGAGLQ